jgi:DNA-damage-inducible protein D
METENIKKLTWMFESFSSKLENGVEFWFARDLQHLLWYQKWDNFQNVILKAKVAIETSGDDINDHFADVGKMIKLGKWWEREVDDIMLTRYACYLIAMNWDSSKEEIAFAIEITMFNTRSKDMKTEN